MPTGSRRLKLRENQTYRGAQAYSVGRVDRRRGWWKVGMNPEKRQIDRQAERHGEGGDVGGGWERKKEKNSFSKK